MNVVIYTPVTILQVLAFGDTVSSNQDINIGLVLWIQNIPVFRLRRKTGQDMVHISSELWNSGLPIYGTGYQGCIQTQFLLCHSADILI